MKGMKNIRYLIWDMDQTLYPYWEDFADYCYEATAHCAVEMGAPISKGEADHLARLSYKERGVTTRLFQERYGLDDVELFQKHHRRMLDRLIEPNWEKKIPPNPELASYLKQAEMHGAVHVLLTNGSREWAESLSERIGIRGCFRVISGSDDHKLRQKGQSMVPYFSVLSRAGYFGDFSDVLVIEDSLKNMEEPKQCGMLNAWVRWGNPLKKGEVVPDFVDQVFDSPNDVAAAWLQARGIQPQIGMEEAAANGKRRPHHRYGMKAPRRP